MHKCLTRERLTHKCFCHERLAQVPVTSGWHKRLTHPRGVEHCADDPDVRDP